MKIGKSEINELKMAEKYGVLTSHEREFVAGALAAIRWMQAGRFASVSAPSKILRAKRESPDV